MSYKDIYSWGEPFLHAWTTQLDRSIRAFCTVIGPDMGSLMVVIMFTILLEGVKDGNAALKGKVVPLADAHLDSVALSQE